MPVTFDDKDSSQPTSDPRKLIRAVDVNELKSVINATEAAIPAAITALKNAAPSQLDTLGEISAAINNDANFATTVSNALATKSPILTIDAAPTNGSTNPVSSNGVFDSLTGLQSDINLRLLISDFVWGEIPSGTINGTNDTFTIANADPSQIAVYSDGIRTSPVNFSVTGTTLVMDGSVIPSSSLLIDYIK